MKRLINQHPGRVLRAALGILPFALLAAGFFVLEILLRYLVFKRIP